jgi:CDGSH-type Zn-finger protein/uncharacterized Fe-S cluster protein YjdI
VSEKVSEYKGDDVVIRYDVKRCIHAAVCATNLPGVFQPDRRPWVDPNGATADQVADVVSRCPTGALQFERRDGGAAEAAPPQNTAMLEADGPVYLAGDIEIVDSDGAIVLGDTRVALCRCGASENKPFCDGRHSDAGFRHAGAIAEARAKPEVFTSGGKLVVKAFPNGPVVLKGSLEVRSADGKTSSFHDAQAALCRCGASAKKPFCDGSHKQVGFTTE